MRRLFVGDSPTAARLSQPAGGHLASVNRFDRSRAAYGRPGIPCLSSCAFGFRNIAPAASPDALAGLAQTLGHSKAPQACSPLPRPAWEGHKAAAAAATDKTGAGRSRAPLAATAQAAAAHRNVLSGETRRRGEGRHHRTRTRLSRRYLAAAMAHHPRRPHPMGAGMETIVGQVMASRRVATHRPRHPRRAALAAAAAAAAGGAAVGEARKARECRPHRPVPRATTSSEAAAAAAAMERRLALASAAEATAPHSGAAAAAAPQAA